MKVQKEKLNDQKQPPKSSTGNDLLHDLEKIQVDLGDVENHQENFLFQRKLNF
jgi:hypothetical protein